MKVFGRLEVKDKSFYHFLDLENSVFDITISSQAPGQEDTTRLRKDRVVIFHNGEYRRHSKSTGAGGYPEMFHNCQIYGETEASSSCHDHNSATTITSPNGSTSAGEVRMVVLLSSWALLVLFTLIN